MDLFEIDPNRSNYHPNNFISKPIVYGEFFGIHIIFINFSILNAICAPIIIIYIYIIITLGYTLETYNKYFPRVLKVLENLR
jgi:hypothetical protein